MSRLLREWLNDEVGLTRSVGDDFGKEFANGYLLGELLFRFNQQQDFHDFIDSQRVSACVENFCRLETTMTRLGVKGFDARTAVRVISGDIKAVVDILHRIKLALNKITVEVGRTCEKGLLPGNMKALTNLGQKTRKPKFDLARSKIFRDALQSQLKGQNEVDMEKHLERFREEGLRQAQVARDMSLQNHQDMRMYFTEDRYQRMLHRQAETAYQEELHAKGITIWSENQKRRRYATELKSRFKERKLVQQEEQKLERDAQVAQQVRNEIEVMEDRVEKHEKDLAVVKSGGDSAVVTQDKEGMLIQNNFEEVDDFINQLRQKTGSDPNVQAERDARRSRFLDDLYNETAEELEDRKVAVLRGFVREKSQREIELDKEIAEQDKFEEVVRANRELRNKQDEEMHETEERQIVELETIWKVIHETQVEERAEYCKLLLESIQQSDSGARLAETEDFCRGLAQDMATYALECLDHFHQIQRPQVEPISECLVKALQESFLHLEDAELQSYFCDEGNWKLESGITRESNAKALGNFLVPLRKVVFPQNRDTSSHFETFEHERFPLQIALLGPPSTGMHLLALRLAAKFNLRILQIDLVLQAYLKNHEGPRDGVFSDEIYADAIVFAIRDLKRKHDEMNLKSQQTNDDIVQKGSNRVEFVDENDLMRKLFDEWDLNKSGDLDAFELLVATFQANWEGNSEKGVCEESFEAMLQMDFNLDGKVTWEEFQLYFELVFGDKKLQAVKRLSQNLSTHRKLGGWILEGFPLTRNQARVLEMRLSGLDVDETEYQPKAAASFPCDEPKLLDRSSFLGLNVGCLDKVVIAKDSIDIVLRNIAKNLRLDVYDSVSRIHLIMESLPEVELWYDTFESTCRVNAIESREDEIFQELSSQLESIIQEKDKRDEEETERKRREEYLASCRALQEEWLRQIPNLTEEELASNEALIERVFETKFYPLLDMITLVEAGLVSQGAEDVNVLDPEELGKILIVPPQDALFAAAPYFKSTKGQCYGLLQRCKWVLDQREIEMEIPKLQVILQNGLSELEGKEYALNNREKESENPDYETCRELRDFLCEYCGDSEKALYKEVLRFVKEFLVKEFSAKSKDVKKKKNSARSQSEPSQSETSPPSMQDVPQDFAASVLQIIDAAGDEYVADLQKIFQNLQMLFGDFVARFLTERGAFDALLRDHERMQERASRMKEFGESFNSSYTEESRFHPSTRSELFARIEDFNHEMLRETLQAKRGAEGKLAEFRDDPWLANFLSDVEETFKMLIKAEFMRFSKAQKALELLQQVLAGIKTEKIDFTHVNLPHPNENLQFSEFLDAARNLASLEEEKNAENHDSNGVLTTLNQVRQQLFENLKHLEEKFIKTSEAFSRRAQASWNLLEERLNERFVTEQAAIEAFTIFCCALVEDAQMLNTVNFDGAVNLEFS